MSKINILFLFAMISLPGVSFGILKGPQPVENLDLEKYVGNWHQLSAIPARFQRKCMKDTTAEYSLLPDGLIKVVNSCTKKNGKRKSSEARARINKNIGLQSTLEVTFVKLLKWVWRFGGDYWVLYISDDYDVAIVGHPEFKYGWILSKKETLNEGEYTKLRNELTSQGYDACQFVMSTTPGQSFSDKTSLCDITAE